MTRLKIKKLANFIENKFDETLTRLFRPKSTNLKRICQLTMNWSMSQFLSVGKKHAATYSVIHVMKRLLGNPFRQPFRAFILSEFQKHDFHLLILFPKLYIRYLLILKN